MTTEIANSPEEWINTLESIRLFMEDNINSLSSIRTRGRCNNCFKKIEDTTISFKEKELHIEGWSHNCNFEKTTPHELIIKHFNKDDLTFIIDMADSECFGLKVECQGVVNISFPLSNYYPKKDFSVHDTFLYGERNLKFKQRSTDKRIILLLQNFIDFKGLDPYFSETIILNFHEEEEK